MIISNKIYNFICRKNKKKINNVIVKNEECQTELFSQIVISKSKIKKMKKFGRNLNCPILNKLLHNIIIIGDLKKDQKLWLINDMLSIDNSVIQPISRWYNKQSRNIIIPFVAKTINIALQNKKYKDIKDFLLVSTDGLENLILSYPEKKREIDILIDLIHKNIGNFCV